MHCAYWVPLTDWKGETKYLEARGVDYIVQLPGNEEPRKWYDRFPGLAEARDIEAEEKAPIEMMIARDNWKWMPAGLPDHRETGQGEDQRQEAPGQDPIWEEAATTPVRGSQ